MAWTLSDRAIEAISNTVLTDFEDALTWAQWCRDLVQAAQWGDEERFDERIADWHRSQEEQRIKFDEIKESYRGHSS